MNKIILHVFAAGFCFAVGQALQCYNCRIGFWNMCITTKVTCDAGEHCYSGTGKAVGVVDVKMKGCLKVAECNTTETVTFPPSSNTTTYTMTKTCCDSDLCNAAPALPSITVLPLALAAFTTVLMGKVLV
ncbi:prostate stem cell antigen [Lampris incognitus]|uniref:prostate stem cell antigen n=1 Tax=Lampris incognitus TaxID=2546036 RepID=UPI0024B54D95|nr:prostate stem cell antigen [Lampris incognitus]